MAGIFLAKRPGTTDHRREKHRHKLEKHHRLNTHPLLLKKNTSPKEIAELQCKSEAFLASIHTVMGINLHIWPISIDPKFSPEMLVKLECSRIVHENSTCVWVCG